MFSTMLKLIELCLVGFVICLFRRTLTSTFRVYLFFHWHFHLFSCMRCATLVSIFSSCNWLGHHYNTQFLKQNFRLITGLVRLAPFLVVSFLIRFLNSYSLAFDQVSVSRYSFISYCMTADFVCSTKFAFAETNHCLH